MFLGRRFRKFILMSTDPPDNGNPSNVPPPEKPEMEGISKSEAIDASYLPKYTLHLERRMKSIETEKQLLDTERLRLERELHALRTELDRLRQPPLIEARVVKILEDKRAVVQSSSGPRFIVNVSKKIKKAGLQPGQHVALNQRTYAIVEDISLDEEDIRKGLTPLLFHLQQETPNLNVAFDAQREAYQWVLNEIAQQNPSPEIVLELQKKIQQKLNNLGHQNPLPT